VTTAALEAGHALRARLEDFYYAYADAIDADLESWPAFFTEDALYKVVARENFDRGLPLASMLCEGHGMILDRVMGVKKTIVHFKRVTRNQASNIRVLSLAADGIRASSSFTVYDTFESSTTRLFAVGKSFDHVVEVDGALRFRERICVFDGDLIQGSIIYPF
jgi:3-phenylpropionate/cinnamic acid dioxygenase small subunit